MGICQGKNTRIFEPTKITQVKVVQKWLQEEAQKNGWTSDAYKNVWINYQDMDMKASLIQTGAVLMDSKYMGSLSTLQKMPDEWWSGSEPWWDQLSGYHCAAWGDKVKGENGVNKWTCDDSKLAVVCEASGSTATHTLKNYLTNANYAGTEEERRETSMMQNGKRVNMMQNGDSGKRADSTNMMQNGKRVNMMQNGDSGKRAGLDSFSNYLGTEEERRETSMMQNGKRVNMMQNGDSGKRADSTNMMQNGDSGKRAD